MGEEAECGEGKRQNSVFFKSVELKKNVKLVSNLQGTNNWFEKACLLDSWF